MARNLIPELERLKDESEQDNTWLRRQKSDVGLLKSPWRSPGWKKEKPFDGDKSVPEVSQLRLSESEECFATGNSGWTTARARQVEKWSTRVFQQNKGFGS